MYHVVYADGAFHIRNGENPVHTPAGNLVTTQHKTLADRLAEHFETYGESAENRRSLALFHYPRLDFIQHYPRKSIEQRLVLGFDPYNDWTFRSDSAQPELADRWKKVFGEAETRIPEGMKWIVTLSLDQLCAAMVLGKAMESMNVAFLASRCTDAKQLKDLLRKITLFKPEFGKDSLEELLANFRFYWEL